MQREPDVELQDARGSGLGDCPPSHHNEERGQSRHRHGEVKGQRVGVTTEH